MVVEKTCSVCGETKPVSHFYPQRGRGGDPRADCRVCAIAKAKAWNGGNADKVRANKRASYQRHREANIKKVKTHYRKNRDRVIAQKREGAQRLKLEVFTHYGACYCCGENNLAFLSLDHINDDGGEFRRSEGGKRKGSGSAFYRWVRSQGYPTDLRSACFNCNYARAHNGGTCPHETERAALAGGAFVNFSVPWVDDARTSVRASDVRTEAWRLSQTYPMVDEGEILRFIGRQGVRVIH